MPNSRCGGCGQEFTGRPELDALVTRVGVQGDTHMHRECAAASSGPTGGLPQSPGRIAVTILDQIAWIAEWASGAPDPVALARAEQLLERFRGLPLGHSAYSNQFLSALGEHVRALFAASESERDHPIEQAKQCIPGDIADIRSALRL